MPQKPCWPEGFLSDLSEFVRLKPYPIAAQEYPVPFFRAAGRTALLLLRLDYLPAFAGVDSRVAPDPEPVRRTDPACPLPRRELDDFAAYAKSFKQLAPSAGGGTVSV